MRNTIFWIAIGLLVVGSLSAVVAMSTVQWLYPQLAPAPGAAPAPGPAARIESADARVAAEFIRLASAGDAAGAAALAPAIPAARIRSQVTVPQPAVERAARLPGVGPARNVLVWVTYRRDGQPARGQYQVTVDGNQVTALLGPLAPEGGFTQPALQVQDEVGRKVDLKAYRGQGLVLVAPRTPEAGLAEALRDLHDTYKAQGVTVVLVIDIGAPDWVSAARQGGFTGPVWRVKSRLEEVPLISRERLFGAAGVLIDRSGDAVASVGVLDPHRYDLGEESALTIAPTVFHAYGLLR